MSQSVASSTDRTIGDYGLLARRRWKALFVGIVLGLALAVLYLNYATPTYVSTAKVLVRSVSTDTEATGSRTAESVNLDTEAQLVKSFTVAAVRRDSSVDDPTSTLTLASAPDLDVVDYQSLGIVDGGELRSHAASAVLGALSESRDLVVLGLPTGDRPLDLPALGHTLDVVVLVVELGLTRRPTISQLLGDLARTNVRQTVAVTLRVSKETTERDGGSGKSQVVGRAPVKAEK